MVDNGSDNLGPTVTIRVTLFGPFDLVVYFNLDKMQVIPVLFLVIEYTESATY